MTNEPFQISDLSVELSRYVLARAPKNVRDDIVSAALARVWTLDRHQGGSASASQSASEGSLSMPRVEAVRLGRHIVRGLIADYYRSSVWKWDSSTDQKVDPDSLDSPVPSTENKVASQALLSRVVAFLANECTPEERTIARDAVVAPELVRDDSSRKRLSRLRLKLRREFQSEFDQLDDLVN